MNNIEEKTEAIPKEQRNNLPQNERINSVIKHTNDWETKLTEIRKNKAVLAWEHIDISQHERIIHLLAHDIFPVESNKNIITELKKARDHIFREEDHQLPEKQGIPQVLQIIKQVRNKIKEAKGTIKKIEFVEEEFDNTEKQFERLKTQEKLLEDILDRLQKPTTERVISLVKKISSIDSRILEKVNKAFRIIEEIDSNNSHKPISVTTTLKNFAEEKFPNILDENSKSLIDHILSEKFISQIIQIIEELLIFLENIAEKNQSIIDRFKNEKEKLRQTSNSTNINNLCKEIDTRAENCKKLLLEISEHDNLLGQSNLYEVITRNIEDLCSNLTQLKKEYSIYIENPDSDFELKPEIVAIKAYNNSFFQGVFKIKYVRNIWDFIVKYFLHQNVLTPETLQTFILQNNDYCLEKERNKKLKNPILKNKINTFLQKHSLPSKHYDLFEKFFLEYITNITNYISTYETKNADKAVSNDMYIKLIKEYVKAIKRK